MPKIHLANPDGQQQVLEETEVRAKWHAGEIPSGSLYWKEGMAEWQPIASFFPAPAPAADPQVPFNPYAAPAFQPEVLAPAGTYAFTKNPRRLTKVLLVFLYLYIIANVLCILVDIGQYLMLGRSYTPAEAEANDMRQGIAGGIFALTFFPTHIIFGMWIYRAAVNSRGFGAWGMRDTPGWSVGWYFIPIMNLFRPYQCMKEIWQVSGNPEDWQSQSGSPVLVTWWTIWLISSFLDNLTNFANKNDTSISALQHSTVISMISFVGGIAVTIAAIKLIRTLIQRQEALVAREAE